MAICFVIQPFDKGKFDKRFLESFKPAIEAAALEAYRVDYDPGVEIPIAEIEKHISKATICLAEISTDNPNVWFELGYAFAKGKQVCMVCSNERKKKYPFDIRHRAVINYDTRTKGGYDEIEKNITAKLKALLQKVNAKKEQQQKIYFDSGQSIRQNDFVFHPDAGTKEKITKELCAVQIKDKVIQVVRPEAEGRYVFVLGHYGAENAIPAISKPKRRIKIQFEYKTSGPKYRMSVRLRDTKHGWVYRSDKAPCVALFALNSTEWVQEESILPEPAEPLKEFKISFELDQGPGKSHNLQLKNVRIMEL